MTREQAALTEIHSLICEAHALLKHFRPKPGEVRREIDPATLKETIWYAHRLQDVLTDYRDGER